MDSDQSIKQLANDIHEIEQQGQLLSKNWFEFQSPNEGDVLKLQKLTDDSLTFLQRLESQLLKAIPHYQPENPQFQDMQHALNLTHELIQSRSASRELLQQIGGEGHAYQEYFRALSIKEKAAENQSHKLKETLLGLVTPRS
jgi:hypothetical protein